jgi:hypothetical protein
MSCNALSIITGIALQARQAYISKIQKYRNSALPRGSRILRGDPVRIRRLTS